MRLTTRWALYVLSDAGQLDVYHRLGDPPDAADPAGPRRQSPAAIERDLLEAISRGRVDDFGQWPRHQEDGARALTTHARPLPARTPDVDRPPLVLRALMRLARRFLVWHAGGIHFAPERLVEWRERASHHVDPDPLVLTAAAIDVWSGEVDARSCDERPRLRPMDERVTQVVTSAPLIPPITLPVVDQLRRRGLIEVHRHHSLSRLPAMLWKEALARDTLGIEDSKPPLYASWDVLIRHARVLRKALLRHALRAVGRPVEGDGEADDLLNALRPERIVKHPDATPLTPAWDRAAKLPLTPARDRAGELPGAREGHVSRERALVLRTLQSLAQPNPPAALGWAFHAYLLLYHQVIQAVLQPPSGRKGLDRFKSGYADSPWHDLKNDELVRDGLQQAWRTGGVQWLELKVTPSKSAGTRIEDLLRQTEDPDVSLVDRLFPTHGADAASARDDEAEPDRDDGAPRATRRSAGLGASADRLLEPDRRRMLPAVRLVFHFIRKPDDPRGDESVRRVAFCSLREEIHRQALSLLEDASVPRYERYIVGLDVASLETDCPTEVFAPVLRAMRSPWPIPSLAAGGRDRSRTRDFGLSVHAGEEFHHLAEGIRRVVETLDFCEYRAGDRLGHALAIGIDPHGWAQRWGHVAVMPRRTRLDDLVWMIDALQGLPAHAALLPKLERERRRLCREVHGRVHDLDVMLEAWRLRMEDPLAYAWDDALWPLSPIRRFTRDALLSHLRRLGDDSEAEALWWETLVDAEIERRGAERIEVEIEPAELDALRALQDTVLRRLVEMRVAIEINPSSNLAIGPFDRMAEHPVFRWDPPGDDPDAIRPSIVVGSDDPAIFGSELLHEYGLLALVAQERGAHPRDISRWLRELHHNAEAFGFGLEPAEAMAR